MSNEPKLFKVNPDEKTTIDMAEVDFAAVGFRERRDIQEWVADNADVLGHSLLVIAKEFNEFNFDK